MVTMASTMTTPVMRRPAGSGFGSVSSLGDNALPPHCSADITLLQILYSSFSLYLFLASKIIHNSITILVFLSLFSLHWGFLERT